MSRDDYAFHCAGCRCNHCANNVETGDNCAGEAIKACFVCDECNWYDGNFKNRDMTCRQCEDYIVTNQHAEYTLQNILSDEWVYADSRNCPILGGEATFSFGEAIKYLKRGMKVARKGWNGKKQYIQLASGISYKSPTGDIVNCEHDAIGNMAVAFVGTSGVQMGWLASQADMLAEDWVFA